MSLRLSGAAEMVVSRRKFFWGLDQDAIKYVFGHCCRTSNHCMV